MFSVSSFYIMYSSFFKMKVTEIESIVDNIWSCGCGYLISPFKEKCEDCGEIKSNKNIDE